MSRFKVIKVWVWDRNNYKSERSINNMREIIRKGLRKHFGGPKPVRVEKERIEYTGPLFEDEKGFGMNINQFISLRDLSLNLAGKGKIFIRDGDIVQLYGEYFVGSGKGRVQQGHYRSWKFSDR